MIVKDRLGREDDGDRENENPNQRHPAHAAYNVNYERLDEFRLE